MCDRFIKLYTCEETEWLVRYHTHAFILLTLIASRARRQNGHPDGLMIGDALIGSSDLEPGMSRQNFRTAMDKLVEFGIVKIISNGKKLFVDRKSTIKVTITGMLVNLCKLTIYDINPEDGNQHINQQVTNDQPTGNHKQERIRKNKKEKEIQITPTPSLPISPKIKFKEFVELTQTEYDSLLTKHGQEFLNRMLDILDAYKGSSGKKYASDYHTMKLGGWVYNRAKQDQERTHEKSFRSPAKTPPGNNANAEPTKFQPNRILRINNAIEGDQRVVHD